MSGHVISEEHILELENIDTRYGRIPCLMNCFPSRKAG